MGERTKAVIEIETAISILRSMGNTIEQLERWWPASKRGSNASREWENIKSQRATALQCLLDAQEPSPMTIDKDGLASLLERVREAKGPDRELDVQIGYVTEQPIESMGIAFRDYCDLYGRDWSKVASQAESHQNILSHGLPRFTANIDASLALAERLLPGWEYVLEGGKRHRCVLLHPGNEEGEGVFVETAPTLPLAILAALLTALKEVR